MTWEGVTKKKGDEKVRGKNEERRREVETSGGRTEEMVNILENILNTYH